MCEASGIQRWREALARHIGDAKMKRNVSGRGNPAAIIGMLFKKLAEGFCYCIFDPDDSKRQGPKASNAG